MVNRDKITNKGYLVFIVLLLLLAGNDHYFKYEFGNVLTGKLSDFIGLLVFPLFLAILVPRLAKVAVIITGLGFVFYKLPASDGFIDFFNSLSFFEIQRTVDYSDFIALLILPFSHLIIGRLRLFSFEVPKEIKSHKLYYFTLLMSFVIFTATSMARPYFPAKGNISIDKIYKIKFSKEVILEKIAAKGYELSKDSMYYSKNELVVGTPYYVIKDMPIYLSDSIQTINFRLDELEKYTELKFLNIEVPNSWVLQDEGELKRKRKFYLSKMEEEIVGVLKGE